jgi:tRNA (guanine37-N1)-methyltransferase
MNITVLTLFPSIVEGYFNSSIMARAVEQQKISYKVVNIRDYALDKHRTCDDAPYGGGPGMVLKPEPLGRAIENETGPESRIIYPSPGGKLYHQKLADELALEKDVTIICGRYEGIDQRIIDLYVNDEISIGDYVLSSGEIAALVIIDAVYRLREGVINAYSLKEESFQAGYVEYPQYTRPETYKGVGVPDVLLSGHHEKIADWRLKRGIEKTLDNRPDLLRKRNRKQKVFPFPEDEERILEEVLRDRFKINR